MNFAKFLRIKFYIKLNFFELSVTLGRGENKYYTQTTANTFTKSNNTWNNFKLKMKEKRLLQFITTFFTFIFHHSIIISMGMPISIPLMDFERFFQCVDLLTIWYSVIIFHDLLNDCLEVYQDSLPPDPSTPKGNRRFGVFKSIQPKT